MTVTVLLALTLDEANPDTGLYFSATGHSGRLALELD